MSEVIPFRPNIDRTALKQLAETVETMAGVMRDMAILMDARAKTAAVDLASLTGRVAALEARLSRAERESAPRAFSAD